jgi:hypothetical protein
MIMITFRGAAWEERSGFPCFWEQEATNAKSMDAVKIKIILCFIVLLPLRLIGARVSSDVAASAFAPGTDFKEKENCIAFNLVCKQQIGQKKVADD